MRSICRNGYNLPAGTITDEALCGGINWVEHWLGYQCKIVGLAIQRGMEIRGMRDWVVQDSCNRTGDSDTGHCEILKHAHHCAL